MIKRMAKIQEMGYNKIKEAIGYDKEGKYQEAFGAYKEGAKILVQAIQFEKNQYAAEQIKSKINEYINRASQLKEIIEKGNDKKPEPQAQGGKGDPKKDDENSKLKDALSGAIVTDKPDVKWSDVAGLENAKEQLKMTVILPNRFPEMFTGKRKPWAGILLYGPPGTGKSYLAKAVATEADGTFFSVSSSDLVSKWQGESARLVKNLFAMAREKKPSIVFIDEIDSLCTSRDSGDSSAGSKQILTEFLVQMDGVGKDQSGVLVLGATNVPWDLDAAIRRRFQKRVYIALPEHDARKTMFKIHMDPKNHCLEDADFDFLASETEGYSGSDISALCKAVTMMPVNKSQSAHYFYIAEDGKYYACEQNQRGAIAMSIYDVPPKQLGVRLVNSKDVVEAMQKGVKSVSQSELKRYEEWTKMYGEDG
ncbi:hypothetical protein WA158_003786 [Blastocystis sp. Blastoise]